MVSSRSSAELGQLGVDLLVTRTVDAVKKAGSPSRTQGMRRSVLLQQFVFGSAGALWLGPVVGLCGWAAARPCPRSTRASMRTAVPGGGRIRDAVLVAAGSALMRNVRGRVRPTATVIPTSQTKQSLQRDRAICLSPAVRRDPDPCLRAERRSNSVYVIVLLPSRGGIACRSALSRRTS